MLRKYRFGPFSVDVQERQFARDGQAVPLTPKAFDLLVAMVERPGQLLTKDELLQKVWPDTFVEEANLAYHVFALRKALGDSVEDAHYVETVPKRGYRFIAPVVPIDEDGVAPEPASALPRSSALTPPRPYALARRRLAPLLLLVPVLVLAGYAARQLWRPSKAPESYRAVPLTSIPGWVSSPALSPDGRFVVFTWTGPALGGQHDLYIQQIGSGSPLRLTDGMQDALCPSWSPDGRTIAFLRRTPVATKHELRVITPTGGVERKVADLETRLPLLYLTSVSWCPDSTCVIASDSSGPGQSDALFAVDIETGKKRQLTAPPPGGGDVNPAVAPDGRALVFRRHAAITSGALFRLDIDGRGTPRAAPGKLTDPFGRGSAAWTADSREVVVASDLSLWRVDAVKGGAPTRLAHVGQDGQSPAIARTAAGRQRLVYVRTVVDINIRTMRLADAGAAATEPSEDAVASTRPEFWPSLSPDGRRLAFVSKRTGEWQVWVSNLDGSAAAELTSLRFTHFPGPPRWSPDGSLIAFHGDTHGRMEVFVVPSSGGPVRAITSELDGGAFPAFSRDGRWIYFSRGIGTESRVWKLPVGGGLPLPVTDVAATMALESLDGQHLYFNGTLDGPADIWRQRLDGGAAMKVLDGVVGRNFAVVEKGLYYIAAVAGTPVPPARAHTVYRLEFLEFRTGKSRVVVPELNVGWFGIDASRDGRLVLHTHRASAIDELTLVDGFH